VAIDNNRSFSLPAIFLVGSLLSGLSTIASLDVPGKPGFFLGAIFGMTITICVAISGLMTQFWQPLLQVCVATIAYFGALMFAIFLQLDLPRPMLFLFHDPAGHPEAPNPFALFFAGIFGAFFVLGAALSLVWRQIGLGSLVRKTMLGSLAGGVFAIIGWALSSTLGTFLWHVLYFFGLAGGMQAPWYELHGLGEARLVYSVHFVWQIGIALIIGILLRPYQRERTRWWNRREEAPSLLH
jgi:hypothetical protein